jgi:hypothetical protein
MDVILDLPHPNCQLVEGFQFLNGVEEDDCGDALIMGLDD